MAITPGDEEECKERVKAICHEFNQSEEGKFVDSTVEIEKKHVKNLKQLKDQNKNRSPYRASWGEQFLGLLNRAFKSVIKEPMVVNVQVGQTIVR